MCAMRTAIIVISFVWFASCSSPETARTRGGGPGADIGNRGKTVHMHEGSRPYEGTPKLIPTESPPLEPARQAEQLSRDEEKG
jgi:hypothetical protein